MAWKDTLSVDIVSIDREHRAMVEGVEAFFARLRAGAERAEVLAGLDDLIGTVRAHFAHEERVMKNIQLPDLAVHRQLHAGLLEEIRLFREELAADVSDRPMETVEHFLHSWLYRHITVEDHKIREHLNRP